MKKSAEIVGLNVISINEGKELGVSKALVINAEEGSVAALVIEDEKWYLGAKLLPFASVAGVGEYAITISSSTDILPIASAPDLESLLEANIKVIGTKVVTKTGRIQGRVTEIIVDDSGSIAVCEVEDVSGDIIEIPSERVFTFGKEVTIIAETSELATPKPASIKSEPIKTSVADISNTPNNIPPEAPSPVSTPIPAAATTTSAVPESPANTEETGKKFDDRHRKYLLGKKASRRIETDNGIVIVEQGGEITEEVLQKAKLAGKFVELSMNIQ